jgi:PD-(D/E)XK endonuclease
VREFSSPHFPQPNFRGAAGVQHVARELLRRGIAPGFPIVDFGYDLLADADGRISRLQIKTQFTVEAKRGHVRSLRFSLRRNKYNRRLAALANRHKTYNRRLVDFMVFVNFARDWTFVVPTNKINLDGYWITLEPDSPYRDAWHLLQKKRK